MGYTNRASSGTHWFPWWAAPCPCGGPAYNIPTQANIMHANSLIKKLKTAVDSSLLKKGQSGHCYICSEAVYHIVGGAWAKNIFKPMHMYHEESSHWFLKMKGSNYIIDPTVDQFKTKPDYTKARGRGFLTKHPSKRAQVLMERLGFPWENK